MTESSDSLQLRLRDAAVELRTHPPRSSYAKADLPQRLAGQFPDVAGPSSPDLLEAIEQALGLLEGAEELADLVRSAIDEATARQRLMDDFPGFSERSYRAAYAEGMFLTR